MRKETARLLADLVSAHSKRTLVGLWSDLSKLSRQEFESLIGPGAVAKPTKTKGRTPAPAAPADSPASRIAELLLNRCSLDPLQAASAVRKQLVAQGVASSRIPNMRNGDFGKWLLELFRNVPASQVMHAAMQIASRQSG